MDWLNEHVIEFIELLQKEPALWNPKNKSRNAISEAWIRIKHRFSVPITIEELKRKKNSLLTQYRDYLKKVKLSMTFDTGEVYKPSWFAFEAMNSFLGSIYMRQPDRITEEHGHYKNETASPWQSSTEIENVCSENEADGDRPTSPESNPQHVYEDPIYLPSSPVRKRRRIDDVAIERKMEDSYPLGRGASVHQECSNVDVCDIYGQLLVHKLKKLGEDDRLRLMNDIDNLAFKYAMAARKRIRLPGPSSFIETPSSKIPETCALSTDAYLPNQLGRRHVSYDLENKVNEGKSSFIHVPVEHRGTIKFDGLSPTDAPETCDILV